MAACVFESQWDPGKASANALKHGVDFDRDPSVFLDPLVLTIPDEARS